jgi:hypothetical protein
MADIKLGIAGGLAKAILLPILMKKLSDPTTKRELVKLINDKIDLPKLTEADEELLLGQIYDALAGVLRTLLESEVARK